MIITEYDGIQIVRDDLYPGGTKARYLPRLFENVDEVVYASPVQGGAQTAMAHVAAQMGKRVTIFCARRAIPHARTVLAIKLGAKIVEVEPGYLTVVQKRAQEYSEQTGAMLAPFGLDLPWAPQAIKQTAAKEITPDEVWCASGSGVLARCLAETWPNAERHVVQVGHKLTPLDVLFAQIHLPKLKFNQTAEAPFPSDPHYDAKAWNMCREWPRPSRRIVLFWNVTGPAHG